MSNQTTSIEYFLPSIKETFNRAAHPAEHETASIKSLALHLLANDHLWQALEESEDSESKQQARELLFGFLRIAHNDENSRIPRRGIGRIRQLIKQVMTAVESGDVLSILPRQQPWSRKETLAYLKDIQTHRDQLRMTIADSLTPEPDRGVIYPPLEAVQDDLRTHTLLNGDRMALGRWENPKTAALNELEMVLKELETVTHTENLSKPEQQYLGILSALAVLNLRLGQLLGRLDFFEQALDSWSAYDRYLQERLKLHPDSHDLKKNLNKDRLTAIAQQTLLGTLTIFDFDLRARWRIRKKAHQLLKISQQGVYLEKAA